jgi:predicted Zn-ribbon and HTH transcriptional regulator
MEALIQLPFKLECRDCGYMFGIHLMVGSRCVTCARSWGK